MEKSIYSSSHYNDHVLYNPDFTAKKITIEGSRDIVGDSATKATNEQLLTTESIMAIYYGGSVEIDDKLTADKTKFKIGKYASGGISVTGDVKIENSYFGLVSDERSRT